MRQIIQVVRFNFLGFIKSPRVIMTFLFGFVLCFLLSDKAMMIAEYFHCSMQAVEPFIWTFGDTTAILLSSLLLILLFIDLPKLSPVTPYVLIHMKKRQWLVGQMIYVVLVTFFYMGYMLLVTCLLCGKKTFVGNIWSRTAALLGYSKLGKDLNVPSTVKVMESTSPYECMLQIVLLLVCYALTLSFLMLFFQLTAGRKGGVLAGLCFSISGFLLNPTVLGAMLHKEEYEMYQIRIFVGWVSPLNHANYGNHNFGYDRLPTLEQSYLLFGGALLLCVLASFRVLKRYNFTTFTGVR